MEFILNYFIGLGLSNQLASTLTTITVVVLMSLLIIIVKLLTDKIVLTIINHFIHNNKVEWDEFFLDRNVFKRASHLVPAIIIIFFASYFTKYEDIIVRFTYIYIVLIGVFVAYAVLNALEDIYNSKEKFKTKPIKGFTQVIKIIIAIWAIIIIIANLIGQSPIIIFSGLGAITAVLLIVFRDSLLGLVAGIQITTNDMVRLGDWIEMPKYNADGDVIEISLNTVKVQNFDRTITTIPAYALISDSFKNWRGMQQSGGRRIKRAIYIDITSIGFLTKDMIEKLKKVKIFKQYIESKEDEINIFNQNNDIDTNTILNGRRLTNIGTFRAYIEHYINNNDKIHQSMIKMVRQLPVTSKGVPLEIYAFTNDVNWINYENVQSDIFDHLFAVAHEFGLKVYQEPSGFDMKEAFSKDK